MRPQKFRGNVFVANLPAGYTDARLAQAFDRFGIVIAACLARDATTSAAKGHGLVDLAPKGAAERAVQAMNGLEIEGRRIEVRLADPTMSLTIPQRIDPHGRTERGQPRPPVRVEFRAPTRTRQP
jgi:RNA recognition motif-containing protein